MSKSMTFGFRSNFDWRWKLFVFGSLALYFPFYVTAWRSAPIAIGDACDYIELSKKLKHGGWSEPHDRMPGYPLVLAAIGVEDGNPGRLANRSLFYFQLWAHAVTVCLLTFALKQLGVGSVLSVLFFLLLLLPPFVDEAGLILTECFTGLLLAGMAYSLVRWFLGRSHLYAWMAGFLGAAAFLVRPVYLFLGPVAAVVYLAAFALQRKDCLRKWEYGLISLGALAIPSALMVFVFVSMNAHQCGYVGLTPKTGFMLFTRTLPFLERIPDAHAEIREVLIRNRDRSLVERGSSHTGTQFIWDGGLEELIVATGKSKMELSNEMMCINICLIKSAPLEYMQVVVKTIAGIWFPPTTQLSFFGARSIQLLWAVIHFIFVGLYFVAFCCFVTAAVVDVRARRHLLTNTSPLHPCVIWVEGFLHLAIWYTAILSSAVEVGDPRYMQPVTPLLLMAVFLFFARWKNLRHV